MIKAIVFDFFGVLYKDAFWDYVQKNIEDYAKHDADIRQLARGVNDGSLTNEEFVAKVAEKTGDHYAQAFASIYEQQAGVNTELLQLIDRLHAGYKTGLLTNANGPWMRQTLNKYKLYPFFDEVVISGEEHAIKPEPEIYGIMLGRLGLEPEEAVFIDDGADNAVGAQAIGMHGLHYTGFATLHEQLKELGIG